MGWWKVQYTEDLIGDEPLDHVGDMVEAVLAAYRDAWGRTPTKAEWQTLLETVFSSHKEELAPPDGPVTKVTIE